MKDIIKRILGLRANFGAGVRATCKNYGRSQGNAACKNCTNDGKEGGAAADGLRSPVIGGGGAEDEAEVSFFMDECISIEMQWEEGGGQCLDQSKSMASIHFQAGITAPFYRFLKQAPERKLFSDASYEAIGGLCLETGV